LAADELGLKPVLLQGLDEPASACGEGVSPQGQRRLIETIGEIADLHRGETVLVITGGAAMAATVAGLALNLRDNMARPRIPARGTVAEVEVDADGWRLVSWPGGS
jgi:broad specificity phosphatase PhoE